MINDHVMCIAYLAIGYPPDNRFSIIILLFTLFNLDQTAGPGEYPGSVPYLPPMQFVIICSGWIPYCGMHVIPGQTLTCNASVSYVNYA